MRPASFTRKELRKTCCGLGLQVGRTRETRRMGPDGVPRHECNSCHGWLVTRYERSRRSGRRERQRGNICGLGARPQAKGAHLPRYHLLQHLLAPLFRPRRSAHKGAPLHELGRAACSCGDSTSPPTAQNEALFPRPLAATCATGTARLRSSLHRGFLPSPSRPHLRCLLAPTIRSSTIGVHGTPDRRIS